MKLLLAEPPRFPTGPDTVLDVPCDDGPMSSTLVQDRSQNANHATLQNSPIFQYPGLLTLGATNSLAHADLLTTLSYPITIMCWSKVFLVSTNFFHFGVFGGPSPYMKLKVQAGSGKARAKILDGVGGNGTAESDSVGWHDSKWHHWAGVFPDRLSRSLYIDTVLLKTETTAIVDDIGDLTSYLLSGNAATLAAARDNTTGDHIAELVDFSLRGAEGIKNHYELTRWKYGV